MPNVQAPDGTVVNFPDSMSSDDIAGVMQQHFPVGGSGHADPSYWDDIKGGAHDLGTAASTGAKAIGVGLNSLGLPGQDTANSVAGSIENITPKEPAGQPGSAIADIKAGNYGQALSDASHSAVRGAVGSAPILAGEALGGPLGAAAGGAAMAFGPTAAARAANNNREMTGADVAAGAAGAIPQGLAAAMLPGAGIPGKIANPLLRAGARTAMGAAGVGGMDLTGQVANTAGTAKGLTVDPEEVGNAALTGGVMGGTAGAAELAKVGIKTGADNLMARTQLMPDTDTARSIMRVTNDAQAIQQQRAAAGQPIAPSDAFNAVKDSRVDDLKRFLVGLYAAQQLDKVDYTQLNNTLDAAQRSNNSLTDGQLGHIQNLDIDDQSKQFLTEKLQDLNTASTQSFKNRQTGPFAIAGKYLGQGAALGGAVASGNPALMAGAVLGHGMEGKIGAGIGGMVDRAMGTNTPPIVLQRLNAIKALKAAGVDPNSVAPMGMPQVPDAVTRPNPTPGFIAPNGMGNVMNPTPPPAPEPSGPEPNPINIMMRAKAGAKLRQPEPGQPDPVTGLPPSPIPVNTPLPANFPGTNTPRPPPVPAFQPNTPTDVRSVQATDDMASGAPQAAPQGLSGAMTYLKRGLPGMTPEQITASLQAHENAGTIAPGTVADLQTAPKVLPAVGAHLQQLAAVGIPTPAPNQGYAVEHSIQARVNADGYQRRGDNYVQIALAEGKPDLAKAIVAIVGEKTIREKRIRAAQYMSTHPGETIPEDLLNQGKAG